MVLQRQVLVSGPHRHFTPGLQPTPTRHRFVITNRIDQVGGIELDQVGCFDALLLRVLLPEGTLILFVDFR